MHLQGVFSIAQQLPGSMLLNFRVLMISSWEAFSYCLVRFSDILWRPKPSLWNEVSGSASGLSELQFTRKTGTKTYKGIIIRPLELTSSAILTAHPLIHTKHKTVNFIHYSHKELFSGISIWMNNKYTNMFSTTVSVGCYGVMATQQLLLLYVWTSYRARPSMSISVRILIENQSWLGNRRWREGVSEMQAFPEVYGD